MEDNGAYAATADANAYGYGMVDGGAAPMTDDGATMAADGTAPDMAAGGYYDPAAGDPSMAHGQLPVGAVAFDENGYAVDEHGNYVPVTDEQAAMYYFSQDQAHQAGNFYEGVETKQPASTVVTEHQLVMRLPPDLAKKVHEILDSQQADDGDTDPIIEMRPNQQDPRMLVCDLFGEEYHAILADLPSVVEVLKTFDKQTYYKGGDISQILRVYPQDWDGTDADMPENPSGQAAYEYLSGLTPQTKGMRKRFRKDEVCTCENVKEGVTVCPKCDLIPKAAVEWAAEEIERFGTQQFTEYYEEQEEYTEYVEMTDDEDEDDDEEENPPPETPHPSDTPASSSRRGRTPGSLLRTPGTTPKVGANASVREKTLDPTEAIISRSAASTPNRSSQSQASGSSSSAAGARARSRTPGTGTGGASSSSSRRLPSRSPNAADAGRTEGKYMATDAATGKRGLTPIRKSPNRQGGRTPGGGGRTPGTGGRTPGTGGRTPGGLTPGSLSSAKNAGSRSATRVPRTGTGGRTGGRTPSTRTGGRTPGPRGGRTPVSTGSRAGGRTPGRHTSGTASSSSRQKSSASSKSGSSSGSASSSKAKSTSDTSTYRGDASKIMQETNKAVDIGMKERLAQYETEKAKAEAELKTITDDEKRKAEIQADLARINKSIRVAKMML